MRRANAHIYTPRFLFQYKTFGCLFTYHGITTFCYISGIHFVEFVATLRHESGSWDLTWSQEVSSQLTPNRSAEMFPNITLENNSHIFYLNICKFRVWDHFQGLLKLSSKISIHFCHGSTRQSQSCGGWGKGNGGWAETFGVFFGRRVSFNRRLKTLKWHRLYVAVCRETVQTLFSLVLYVSVSYKYVTWIRMFFVRDVLGMADLIINLQDST